MHENIEEELVSEAFDLFNQKMRHATPLVRNRVVKIINSCRNEEQLRVAIAWLKSLNIVMMGASGE